MTNSAAVFEYLYVIEILMLVAGIIIAISSCDDLVVDLHSLEEAPQSPFAGARRLDVDGVATLLAEPPSSRRIVLCCRSGQRSLAAADRPVTVQSIEGGVQDSGYLDGRPVPSGFSMPVVIKYDTGEPEQKPGKAPVIGGRPPVEAGTLGP